MKKTLWVCAKCGSPDVEVKAWIDANTKVIMDEMGEDIQDTFCNNCRDHHGLEQWEFEDYIPELDEDQKAITWEEFIEIAKGNMTYARMLRERVTWQHPATLVDEDLREDEIKEYMGTYLLQNQ